MNTALRLPLISLRNNVFRGCLLHNRAVGIFAKKVSPESRLTILPPLINMETSDSQPVKSLTMEDIIEKRIQFIPLYRFRLLASVIAFSKMKIYLTGLSVLVLPPLSISIYSSGA